MRRVAVGWSFIFYAEPSSGATEIVCVMVGANQAEKAIVSGQTRPAVALISDATRIGAECRIISELPPGAGQLHDPIAGGALTPALAGRARAQRGSTIRQGEQDIGIPRAVQAERLIHLQIARPDIETRRVYAQ
jgi:hypothetical protein